jgi:two-component system response regulator RegX3
MRAMAAKPRVLVVDDDVALSEMLGIVLRAEGFDPAFVGSGDWALRAFREFRPDLVLLDLMLPGLSGLEVCRLVRTKSTVPIIMLTAKDGEIDKVVGLEIGADDYVTKPFSSRELLARVRSVLRRNGEPEELLATTVEAGPVRMDVDRHVVTVRGETMAMPLKEFDLLELLVRNAGRVLTRSQLIDRVWGADYVGDTKTLDVHVKRLRAKVEEDPANPVHLVTVRGLGYKFEP